ncbi:MAG: hypothetical protein WDW38_010608 [Sanguina aurantia]
MSQHLAPALGCVVAFIMFVSPLWSVLDIRKQQQLGNLNPVPLVAIIANCAIWLIYGCINQDVYVILANLPGLHLGFFMTVSCYGFAGGKLRDTMMKVLLFFVLVISVAGVGISLLVTDREARSKAAGYAAVFVLLCYYTAPLGTLTEVIRTRSSASLYWPSSVMNAVNGSLWVAYGTAVGDNFIFYPNCVGLCCGLVQIALCVVLPSKPAASDRGGPLDGDEDHDVRSLLHTHRTDEEQRTGPQ